MKLLANEAAWQHWVKVEAGPFADSTHPLPVKFPCYAYMVLESWGQETLRACYLYQHDVDEMVFALIEAGEQRRQLLFAPDQ